MEDVACNFEWIEPRTSSCESVPMSRYSSLLWASFMMGKGVRSSPPNLCPLTSMWYGNYQRREIVKSAFSIQYGPIWVEWPLCIAGRQTPTGMCRLLDVRHRPGWNRICTCLTINRLHIQVIINKVLECILARQLLSIISDILLQVAWAQLESRTFLHSYIRMPRVVRHHDVRAHTLRS